MLSDGYYTGIQGMKKRPAPNKWVIMKILISRGIHSYDEDNYKDMDAKWAGFDLETKEPFIKVAEVGSLINEYIYKTEYDKFNRKYKIESILENVD